MPVITVAPMCDIFDDGSFDALIKEYADESVIEELKGYSHNRRMYQKLQDLGFAEAITARKSGILIGAVIMMITEPPHYSQKIAVIDSYFVGKKHRSAGVGLHLLKKASAVAIEKNCIGLFASAPVDSRLETLLSLKKDFRHTHSLFFKGFLRD